MWILDLVFWGLVSIVLLPALLVGLVVPWGTDGQSWSDE